MVYIFEMLSPIGVLQFQIEQNKIKSISIQKKASAKSQSAADRSFLFKKIEKQFGDFFSGKSKTLDLPMIQQGTPFQMSVWRAMRQIPYGKTISYGELAKQVGRPRAARAVGQACNKNPLLILVPCHRVVAQDGSLGGFAVGTTIKKQLLGLEYQGQNT